MAWPARSQFNCISYNDAKKLDVSNGQTPEEMLVKSTVFSSFSTFTLTKLVSKTLVSLQKHALSPSIYVLQ